MSYTNGPWEIQIVEQGSDSRGAQRMIIIVSGDMRIATMYSEKDRVSNANLIAAAPDLLEACKALQMEAAARNCGLKIADDAIAKAEGR